MLVAMKKIRLVTDGSFLVVRKVNHNNRLANEWEASVAGCYDSVASYEDCEQDRRAMDDLKRYTNRVLASTGCFFKFEEIEV